MFTVIEVKPLGILQSPTPIMMVVAMMHPPLLVLQNILTYVLMIDFTQIRSMTRVHHQFALHVVVIKIPVPLNGQIVQCSIHNPATVAQEAKAFDVLHNAVNLFWAHSHGSALSHCTDSPRGCDCPYQDLYHVDNDWHPSWYCCSCSCHCCLDVIVPMRPIKNDIVCDHMVTAILLVTMIFHLGQSNWTIIKSLVVHSCLLLCVISIPNLNLIH